MLNYIELRVGDFVRRTQALTLAQHGAYTRLLLAYLGGESPLPEDPEMLCRIAGARTRSEQAAALKVADLFFPVADDGLRHDAACDEYIAHTRKRIETCRSNGRLRNKKQQPKANPVGYESSDESTAYEEDAATDAIPVGIPVGKPNRSPPITNHQSRASLGNSEPHTDVSHDAAQAACLAMQKAGAKDAYASSPELRLAIDEGIKDDELATLVQYAISHGKAAPARWAIATARARAKATPVAGGAQRSEPARTAAYRAYVPERREYDMAAADAAHAAAFEAIAAAGLLKLDDDATSPESEPPATTDEITPGSLVRVVWHMAGAPNEHAVVIGAPGDSIESIIADLRERHGDDVIIEPAP